jgi:hypothetical protein
MQIYESWLNHTKNIIDQDWFEIGYSLQIGRERIPLTIDEITQTLYMHAKLKIGIFVFSHLHTQAHSLIFHLIFYNL